MNNYYSSRLKSDRIKDLKKRFKKKFIFEKVNICNKKKIHQWIKKNKKDDGVKGIIVAGRFDDKLDHARIMIPNCEVFLYDVIFKLSEYKK